jgi:sulfoxide reductase catalytic subunit YedY
MPIKTRDDGFVHPITSEITPNRIYEQRRELLRLMAGGAAGAVLAGWAARDEIGRAHV